MKKNFTTDSRRLSIYDLDGSLDEIIDDLVELRRELVDKGWENIRSDVDYWVDETPEWVITGDRPMTDAEKRKAEAARKRKAKATAKKKADKEAAERKEFERLKAKFEA